MLKNYSLLSAFAVMMMLSGCEIRSVDSDYASQIDGTYSMTYYEMPDATNSNPGEGNEVIITRVEDESVSIEVRFSDPNHPIVETEETSISRDGDDVYTLEETFSTADLSGTVDGDELDLLIEYHVEDEDGEEDYVSVRATLDN